VSLDDILGYEKLEDVHRGKLLIKKKGQIKQAQDAANAEGDDAAF